MVRGVNLGGTRKRVHRQQVARGLLERGRASAAMHALTKALPEPRFRELTALFRGRKPRMLRALMAGLRRLGWVRSEAGSWRKAHGEGPAG